jgi:hypothetical protein
MDGALGDIMLRGERKFKLNGKRSNLKPGNIKINTGDSMKNLITAVAAISDRSVVDLLKSKIG